MIIFVDHDRRPHQSAWPTERSRPAMSAAIIGLIVLAGCASTGDPPVRSLRASDFSRTAADPRAEVVSNTKSPPTGSSSRRASSASPRSTSSASGASNERESSADDVDDESADSVADADSTEPIPARRAPSQRTGPVAASEGLLDIKGVVGAPPAPTREPLPADAPQLVDGIVGYINNKAIYITDFLSPMEQRLRARAREMPRDQWVRMTHDLIAFGLDQLIQDELLRAEALASFSPEQKQGLSHWLRLQEADVLSKSYGSREMANAKLRDKEGVTDQDRAALNATNVDEFLQAKEEQELISFQLSKQIYRRTNVSWRDIRLGYEKQYDTFNPAPAAEFRLIRVNRKDAETVRKIGEALTGGADFAELASSPDNQYRADEGGLIRQAFTKDFTSTEFFAIPELNDQAHRLIPGQHAGPIETESSAFWIFLERIDRRSMGLYDAQLQLEREIFGKRTQEARARYIERLKRRASFTDLTEMTDRLLRVAIERYYPTDARSRPPGR